LLKWCLLTFVIKRVLIKKITQSSIYNFCIQSVPDDRQIFRMLIERIKLSRKILYHFAIFAIVNKILITNIKIAKYWFSIIFYSNIINLLKYYQQKNNKKQKLFIFFLDSSRILRMFSEFFINFLVLYFLIYWQLFLPTWENVILRNSIKI